MFSSLFSCIACRTQKASRLLRSRNIGPTIQTRARAKEVEEYVRESVRKSSQLSTYTSRYIGAKLHRSDIERLNPKIKQRKPREEEPCCPPCAKAHKKNSGRPFEVSPCCPPCSVNITENWCVFVLFSGGRTPPRL